MENTKRSPDIQPITKEDVSRCFSHVLVHCIFEGKTDDVQNLSVKQTKPVEEGTSKKKKKTAMLGGRMFGLIDLIDLIYCPNIMSFLRSSPYSHRGT